MRLTKPDETRKLASMNYAMRFSMSITKPHEEVGLLSNDIH